MIFSKHLNSCLLDILPDVKIARLMKVSSILLLATVLTSFISEYPSMAQASPTIKLDNEADKKAQTQIYLSQGHYLFDQGLYDKSMVMANKAIDLSPSNALAWQLLGNCLKKIGRDQEALTAYDQAVRLLAVPETLPVKPSPNLTSQPVITNNPSPNSSSTDIVQLWVERARTLERLNRFQESIAAYDQALKIRCQEQMLQSPNNLPSVCEPYLPKQTNSNSNYPNTLEPRNNQPQNTVIIPIPVTPNPTQQPKPKPNPTIW